MKLETIPHSKDIERAVIGAMLIDSDAIKTVIETDTTGIFYFPQHEVIFKALEHLHEHGDPVDQLTLCEQLARDGALDNIGGASREGRAQGAPRDKRERYFSTAPWEEGFKGSPGVRMARSRRLPCEVVVGDVSQLLTQRVRSRSVGAACEDNAVNRKRTHANDADFISPPLQST